MSTFSYAPPAGGAGVRVVRNDNSVAVNPGRIGTVLFAGAYSKGPVGQYLVHTGRDHYARSRKGDLLVEDQTQLAVKHFFEKAGGKGTLVTLRICDGTERAATLTLRDRNVDTTYRTKAPSALVRGTVGKLVAASAGTWAGKALTYGGQVADASAAFVGSTLITGLTCFAKDELKGASLYVEGQTRVWVVTANTAAGVITVRGDFSTFTPAASPLGWRVERTSVYTNGKRRELSAVVTDGRQDRDGNFGLVVAEDGKPYTSNPWGDLSLDADDPRAWQKVIDEALARQNQWEVDADDLFTGDPALQYLKPANWAGRCFPQSANTLLIDVFDWTRSGAGTGYCDRTWFRLGTAVVPHTLTLTFTGATTYTVAATDAEGVEIASDLPDGTVGTKYDAPHPHLSGHKVVAGDDAFEEGDTIVIQCSALPLDLPARGGWFFPYAFAATGSGGKDVSRKFRITGIVNIAGDTQKLTLGIGDDITDVVVAPGVAGVTGATDGPFATTGVTFKYRLIDDGVLGDEVTLTMTGGAAQTAQEAADELAVLETTGSLSFYAEGDKLRVIRYDARGPGAGLKITTGTINAVVGFTPNTSDTGDAPTIGRVEYDQAFTGGKDGIAGLTSEHYAAAFDVETSSLLDILQHNLGLIKVALPSTYAPEAQQAVANYCESQGLWYCGALPENTLDESAATKTLRDNIIPTEHLGCDFPSFGYLKDNPYGGTTPYLSTLLGLILGEETARAVDRKGYHKAPAGEAYRIDSHVRRLPTDAGDSPKPVKDYLLNPTGIRSVVHQGTAIYLFGDQSPALGYAGTVWTHKVQCVLHVVAECRANLGQYVYEVPDDVLYGRLKMALRNLLKPHWRAGWFKGGSFEAAVRISCNAATNPPEVQEIGTVVASVSFECVETSKVVEVQIGTAGIAVPA